MVLVLGRLGRSSSELHLVEQGHEASALAELLGVHRRKMTTDSTMPGTPAVVQTDSGKTRSQRVGELFALGCDLPQYDVTSTYFEGDFGGVSVPLQLR
ncbi:MAG: hypothetical protein ABSD13_15615 [Candidatus Korobacteraceae bacterium]